MSMATYWKLVGTVAVPVTAPVGSPAWLEVMQDWERNRSLRITLVGDVRVSTVFLCFPHPPFDDEMPALFETMVFDDSDRERIQGTSIMASEDLDQRRYHTWDEAMQGHAEIVSKLIAATKAAGVPAAVREVRLNATTGKFEELPAKEESDGTHGTDFPAR